ncbi:MAG: hypothetical protein EHM87_25385 [Burkholderiales bacterium]|nr:MAG: hypothetical protein EHM87_25385 [Burkholderiales bacterium]
MSKKKSIILLFFFILPFLACKRSFDFGFSESTFTPTLTAISSPTFTPTPEFRVIPSNYYRITTTKISTFYDKEITRTCIQTNTHRITRTIDEEVVEILSSSAYQTLFGDCSAYTPEEWGYQVNIYTGEFIKNTQGEQSSKTVYFGKSISSDAGDIFSLSNNPIPVWKVTTPITRKNLETGEDSYKGTDESLIDKATGILIYRFESLVF